MTSRENSEEMVDAVTLEVVRNAAAALCEEMNATLVQTSYSPNIKERQDCSCALFDASGMLLAQAETLPVHLGAMPFSVAAAVDKYPPGSLTEGDAILLNDPYAGGAHLPDLTLVTPVILEDELVAFTANRAHHADIGGATAGSVGADAREIYGEGLRLPPVKLQEGGVPNDEVYDIIDQNVRTPMERRGDLRAQVAANNTGVQRYRDLADRYGRDHLQEALTALCEYSEERMRAELAAFPDGEYRFDDVLDDDGRGNENLSVVVTLTIADDDVTVDFAGTADQTTGPINAVYAVTASATYYAVRAITDPDIPPNAGCYRPITINTPTSSLVDSEPPAAVVAGNLETSQRITDVVLGAFAKAVPNRSVAACQGTMNNITFGGTDPDGNPFTFYETQAGRFGAHATGDGMDAVHVHMSNTLNTPIEVLETTYPLRVQRYHLRPDSGGAGEYRGGLGVRRDIEVQTDVVCSVLAERHTHPPYGIEGGEPGGTGATYLFRDGETTRLPAKTTLELAAGETISLRTPGAGGYGDPTNRTATAIERDLRLEKLTESTAADHYNYHD